MPATPPATPATAHVAFDVAIIGAGPAGCAAALWLGEMGWRVALLEKAAQPLAALAALDLRQNWVLGEPNASMRELAARYADHALGQRNVTAFLSDFVVDAQFGGQFGAQFGAQPAAAADVWTLRTHAGQTLECRAIGVCTGVRPRVFAHAAGKAAPLNAAELTNARAHLPAGRFLLLGGGDNAVENAAFLAQRGHAVTLWSRSPLRAGKKLLAALQETGAVHMRTGDAMPDSLERVERDGRPLWQAGSGKYGTEFFEHAAVLFGNGADSGVLQTLAAGAHCAVQGLDRLGVWVAGDASGRWHPCISTAVADGVQMAKHMQAFLENAGENFLENAGKNVPAGAMRQMPDTLSAPDGHAATGQRHLSLTGLRFHATLGILEHEKNAPQPIQVDAELNLGMQPLRPRDDDITHVLDYRKVRQIIIDECTAEHVNLLETLIGKLSQRLMGLPGVLGVRVKIAKLEIFGDCEVAMKMQAGRW